MRIILDHLEEAVPVQSVHATGGVFRSTLWRKVMAAALDRPFYVIGEAEGTALGAAALGLLALGRTDELADAVSLLVPTETPAPSPVEPDPELVATYAATRASLPELVAALDAVGALFAGTARHG